MDVVNYVSDGFIQRKNGESFQGTLTIEGVNISPIEASFFSRNGTNYLWIKRKPILEYDNETKEYNKRERKPKWEAYLEKKVEDNTVKYVGSFYFLRLRYKIVGTWDNVFGIEKTRLNLYVDRYPIEKQIIINKAIERNNEQ